MTVRRGATLYFQKRTLYRNSFPLCTALRRHAYIAINGCNLLGLALAFAFTLMMRQSHSRVRLSVAVHIKALFVSKHFCSIASFFPPLNSLSFTPNWISIGSVETVMLFPPHHQCRKAVGCNSQLPIFGQHLLRGMFSASRRPLMLVWQMGVDGLRFPAHQTGSLPCLRVSRLGGLRICRECRINSVTN